MHNDSSSSKTKAKTTSSNKDNVLKSSTKIVEKIKFKDSVISDDRAALYRRHAALKKWGNWNLEQPPVRQLFQSMAKTFEVSIEQLIGEWESLLDDHPFREIVSLNRRSKLQHKLFDENTCKQVVNLMMRKGNQSTRPHLDEHSKDSFLASTVVWDEYRPRVLWRKLFNTILPDGFFEDVGRLLRTVRYASSTSNIVDISEPFVPRRIQVNIYPAGKKCGLPAHWDRHAILGVTTILLTAVPKEDSCDDMFLSEEYDDFHEGGGWECGGLRLGSGLCVLVGTTHAVRTRVRTKTRVTMNVIF